MRRSGARGSCVSARGGRRGEAPPRSTPEAGARREAPLAPHGRRDRELRRTRRRASSSHWVEYDEPASSTSSLARLRSVTELDHVADERSASSAPASRAGCRAAAATVSGASRSTELEAAGARHRGSLGRAARRSRTRSRGRRRRASTAAAAGRGRTRMRKAAPATASGGPVERHARSVARAAAVRSARDRRRRRRTSRHSAQRSTCARMQRALELRQLAVERSAAHSRARSQSMARFGFASYRSDAEIDRRLAGPSEKPSRLLHQAGTRRVYRQ